MNLARPAAVLGCILASAACSSGLSAGHTDANTAIRLAGGIGGIHAGETRSAVEAALGSGTDVSATTRHSGAGSIRIERVAYRLSQLEVVYVRSPGRPPTVFGISTISNRYRTGTGPGVGSTLRTAQRTPGVRCSPQATWLACQAGLGYERPVTVFTVRDGRVFCVSMAAVAD